MASVSASAAVRVAAVATKTTLWQRSIESDVSSVKSTFTSWDQCMSKTYCKWPAIIGIIVACLLIISLLWCVLRCICCGAECCCGCLSCLSCCGSCCPNGRRRNQGYTPAAPAPQPYAPYAQYQSAPPPMYGGPSQPQYTYLNNAPNTAKSGPHRYNEDALPDMPSWNQSRTTRAPVTSDVEMGRIYQPQGAARALDHGYQANAGAYYGDQPRYGEQRYGSPHQDGYAYGEASPQMPSNSHAPLAASVGRRPVQGAWRDV